MYQNEDKWMVDILSLSQMIWIMYHYFKDEVSCNWENTFSLKLNQSGFYIGVGCFWSGNIIDWP